MLNLSLQITSPSFLDSGFTSQMDLMTGKPFYHSEWGELFAMLPFDVQDSIASAIWRYVFSNHVLKIPTTIKILEPGELHRNQTMSEWVSLAANGYEDKVRNEWYEVRRIHQSWTRWQRWQSG